MVSCYKVDSKLPDPVYILVNEVLELIPVEEYMSQLPVLEGFCHDSPFAQSINCRPEHRPMSNSSYHPRFADLYQPVKLDNGSIVCIARPKDRELKIGDQVRYDIRCDEFTLFEIQNFACKLTLVENTDAC